MRPFTLCVALVMSVLLPRIALGQFKADMTTAGTAKLLQADYAVPDAPALKMIDADESKLLRPVSVKTLMATLSSATGDFSFIPRALGVEFSPGMLINGERLTLAEYRSNPWWYRLRLSLAAKRDTGSSARNQIAGAVRIGIQDKSDLRTNDEVIKAILALTRLQVDSALTVKERWDNAGIPRTGPKNAGDSARAKEIEKQVAQEFVKSLKSATEAAKRTQEDARWNADVFDMAFAVRASSLDSTGKDIRFDGVAVWLTKGWGLRRGAQLLLGGRGSHERDLTTAATDERESAVDVVTRLYVGSNKYKALVEVQGTGRSSSKPKWVANGGGELQLAESIWVNATAGFEAAGDIGNGRFISSFKLKLTPPDR